MFALLDGNNFYCSVEAVFRPSLKGKPVVVLSNNDGCAISRSEEAKALGVKMGQPYFEIKALERVGLQTLSANFSLYGNMSDRMMSIVRMHAPAVEVYSIDEAFMSMRGLDAAGRMDLAQQVRQKVGRWIGIPTCIGMGPTKTLAKLANHVAKSAERKPGSYPGQWAQVFDFAALSASDRQSALALTPVAEVWGVGPRLAPRLKDMGIGTAWDLSRAHLPTLRKRFSVVIEKTALELQGVSCLSLEEAAPPHKQIMCSRSFGRPVTEHSSLAEALTEFTARAAEKLRAQGSVAKAVHVFITTSPFRPNDAAHAAALTLELPIPTQDTRTLLSAVLSMLQRMHRAGHRYVKAGVALMDLAPAHSATQGELTLEAPRASTAVDLFTDVPISPLLFQSSSSFGESGRGPTKSKALMQTIDDINRKFGRGSVRWGSAGLGGDQRDWLMRQRNRSPRYTTHWDELPIVRA